MEPDWDLVDPPAPDDFGIDGAAAHDGDAAVGSDGYEDFGPPRAADGIKARSRRGAIGDTWWSRRFVDVLDGMGHGGRLARGRTYARKGQVVTLEVEPGAIRAEVQGSRPGLYDVVLGVAPVSPAKWGELEAALAGRAAYAATLLDGRLPHEIEDVARDCGIALLPKTSRDLLVDCTCPDAASLCKHIAAVCYLAAEAFDDDPFLLLLWRGRTREDLLAGLRRHRSGSGSRRQPDPRRRKRRTARPDPAPEAAVPAESFWEAGPGLDGIRVRPAAARVADAVLSERGPTGLRVGPLDVEDVLGPMYLRITQAAEARAYGDE